MSQDKNEIDNYCKILMDINSIHCLIFGYYNNNIIITAINENEYNNFITDVSINNIYDANNIVHLVNFKCPICHDKKLRHYLLNFIKFNIGLNNFAEEFFKIDTHTYIRKDNISSIKIADSKVFYSIENVKDCYTIEYYVNNIEEMFMLRERIQNAFPDLII